MAPHDTQIDTHLDAQLDTGRGPAGSGAGTGVDTTSAGSARVEIAAGGHQVVVEAPEPLAVVAATAMNVWTATDPPNLARGYSPVGFAAEAAVGPVPADLTLPARMTDWTTDDRTQQ